MSRTIVKYGDYDFSNQPTPFLTRSETFIKAGENWGTQEIFTLRGQITGCDFDAIRSGQAELISGFGRDFQSLQIGSEQPDAMVVEDGGDTNLNTIYFRSSNNYLNYPWYANTIRNPGDPIDKSIEIYTNPFLSPIYRAWLITTSQPPIVAGYTSNIGDTPPTPDLVTGWLNASDGIDIGGETATSVAPSPTVREATWGDLSIYDGVESSGIRTKFGNILINKSGIKVESINFPSNPYKKILDYEITLSHFPDNYFTQFYGVTNPVDSWDFNEGENGLLNITHNISCKGFNTHSGANNAFQNARNFVYSRTGNQNMINPHFICKNTYPEFYPCLDSFTENINRIDGTYSITENYISDLEGTGRGVLRYQVDLSSGVNDFSTATIRGNIDGCKENIKINSAVVENAGLEILNQTYSYSGKDDSFEDVYSYDNSPSGALVIKSNTGFGLWLMGGSGIDGGDVQYTSSYDSRGPWVNTWSPFSGPSPAPNVKQKELDSLRVVRSRFKEFKFFDTVAEVYSDAFGFVDLNPEGLSTGIQEDSLNKKITFDVSYNNDQSPQTILDVQTNVASGDSHITVSVDGNIRARGDIRDRYAKISGIYDNTDVFGYAKDAYISYLGGTPTYPLNPKPESSGVTRDQFTPVISFNATFTNKEIPPDGFESFTRNISVKPSLRSIKPVPLFDQNGTYDIVDLLFDRRARISVDINGVASPNETSSSLTNTLKQEGNLLLQTYGRTNSLKLESYNISTGNLGEYSLNATWSFEAANKIYDGTNYDEVNTLKIK